jgi:hypothetical protein
MSIEAIELWHKRARPEPSFEDFNVQLGCHFEEITEMLIALTGEDGITNNKLSEMRMFMMSLAEGFKSGRFKAYASNRREFLDALADQVVTAVGVGYCDKMQITEAVKQVNESNWSKFDYKGYPIFNENGKIAKGPTYKQPELDGLY